LIGGAGIFTAFVLAGFVIGQAGTMATDTRSLPASTGKVTVAGWIDGVSSGAGTRERIILSVDEIPEVKPEHWPGKVRLSVSPKDLGQHQRGDYVRFSAWLYPPLTPAMPGGWNYGRVAWCDDVGAGGRVAGAVAKPGTQPDQITAFDTVAQLRSTIAARVRASLPKREAEFAVALITGERTGLDKKMREALQLSGLAYFWRSGPRWRCGFQSRSWRR
jgi:competence protein ComEC